jgi:hypothetical protein
VDGEAEPFNAPLEVVDGSGGVEPIEEGVTEVSVGDSGGENVEDRDEDLVRGVGF